MKKILNDKSFWIILIISIVSLVSLTVSVIFLTRMNSKEFYSSGYIISSNATSSNKYYFNNNTVYKENVFNEYVFKDVDNKEVKTGKDNFIHYLDESMSFMKNGVILDLDNFKENLVPYYNITDKSIIKYNNGGYYVETADKTLVFGNFLGRITDDKYIVVGKDIRVKLAGNDEAVRGNYFEILFVENGVVKIENQEGSYQTLSDGTTVYVGEGIVINLGDKSLSYDDEVKLSLEELTIDGNENIEITPSGEADSNDDEKDGTDTDNDGTNTPDNNENPDIQGGNDNDGDKTILKKEVSVNLISASADMNSIMAVFQVIDTASAIKGNLVLTLVNTETGQTVYRKILANTPDEQTVIINSLSSSSNYVMTITDEDNTSGIQYFQKSFRTDSLDLKLVRKIVTEDSLAYTLDFGVNESIKSADISLYNSKGEIIGTHTIVNGTEDSITFAGLKNNSLYDVVVNNVVIDNVGYGENYSSRTSDLTLKKKPVLGEISVKTSNEAKSFVLNMDKVNDPDESIVSYTYQIFKAEDITESTISTAKPVYSFTRNKLESESISLDGTKGLVGNLDYRFKIVVKYYDNYRYNEIETKYSDYFQVVGKPTISFEASAVEFNRIAGTVTINDVDCTIPFEGRECNDKANNFIIRYYGGSTMVRNTIKDVTVDPLEQTLSFDLNGLTENTLYTFEVYADVDLHNESGLQKGQYIGGFNVATSSTSALMIQNWKNNNYSFEVPISVSGELVPTVPEDDPLSKLASITFNLYSGNVRNNIGIATPIASFIVNENIKEQFGNKEFFVNSNMFEINDLEELKKLSGGSISRYYTIEVADAFDISGANEFAIMNNVYVYEVPAILRLEDEVAKPEIAVEEITNIQTKSGQYEGISYDGNLDDEIVRGYKVTAVFDKNKVESYFSGENPINKITFYADTSDGVRVGEKTINLLEEDVRDVYFFLGEGTDYDISDKDMRRGNTYVFSYDMSIDDDGDASTTEINYPEEKPVSDEMTSLKQRPRFKMYIDNSSDSSLTYKYKVFDYDNALYKEDGKYYFYYTVNSGEEERVEIFKKEELDTLVLEGLENSSIYEIKYQSAISKNDNPSKITFGSYYFDGFYDPEDYNIGFKLQYEKFDNRLKVILNDNEFLNRVSAYLLTLTAGDDKYQVVVSKLDNCNDSKCIIVDYKDIQKFKGKDIKVSLDAFYDTGFVGFSQMGRLGSYFEKLGFIKPADAKSVGFIYQVTGTNSPGQYYNVKKNSYTPPENSPKGILAFSLNSGNVNDYWKLNTSNLLDIANNKFVSFGEISMNNSSIFINDTGSMQIYSNERTINPKVLDRVTIQTDKDNFSFTSIIPKVSVNELVPYINGASMNVSLSVDDETLKTDFVQTDGKYKFYIDIYGERECGDESDCADGMAHIKTVETDYENLSNIEFEGLTPDTRYTYKISADMNINGVKEKAPLFKNSEGYVEFQEIFDTLDKEQIFKKVGYDYESTSNDERYDNRNLKLTSYLKTNKNFNLKYQLYDKSGEITFEGMVSNAEFKQSDNQFTAVYDKNISGKDFVFGSNYYNLVITAVTTDLAKELELYNDNLVYNDLQGQNFHELRKPEFKITQSADISSITYTITVTDIDKVINDGIYNIELQDSAYENACAGNPQNCRVTVNIKNGTCTFGNSQGGSCSVVGRDANNQVINVTFNNLKADTNYVLYAYADIYRNNTSLSDKEELVYVRKNQYTKSELGFSLGAVTPTATSRTSLTITFAGATNISGSNGLLVGIDYNITVQGGAKVTSGSLGKTDTSDGELKFGLDADGYPTLTIPIPSGQQLGLNNYIIITYYYKTSEGKVEKLKIGENTSYQYTVKNEG